MVDVLKQAIQFTLANEGGYSNNPSDHGGATNRGIIQRELNLWNKSHPEMGFPEDVVQLRIDQAEAIYRANYWRWDFIQDPLIAIKAFDIGVNCGPGTATKLLQRAAKVPDDGQIGTQTIAAVNGMSSTVEKLVTKKSLTASPTDVGLNLPSILSIYCLPSIVEIIVA